ncbi:MAG: hypothetical protein J6B95_02365 [Oscillospiraceae bacterium]|nr:hypothetical protein [Oscillospiraceae bacterium]
MHFNIYKVAYTDKRLIQKILEALIFLKQDYPDFLSWYRTKVMAGLEDGSRQIYVAAPDHDSDCIAAVMILKNDGEEKKISTLCVMENFRSLGLGSRLVALAMERLNCNAPIITVSDVHKNEFDPLLNKFGFEHFEEYPAYYKDGISEHCYNGYLNPQKSTRDCKEAS